MRVLVVEDDTKVSKSVSLTLANYQGIVCDCVQYGQKALMLATNYDYDIILLDLSLPDMDGYEVLLKLRTSKIKTPVLVLTSLAAVDQKVKCLDNGADDYMTKPFDYGELISRIKAIARRSKGKANSVLRIGSMVINFDDRVVTINNQEIPLTSTEYAILELLAVKRGNVLTKETFINHLYHGVNERQPKIVDVFICKLRDKLKKASGGEEFISTVWGRGYILKSSEDSLLSPVADFFSPVAKIKSGKKSSAAGED